MVLADYDECKLGLNNCHEDATCRDEDRGFTCTCNPGYIGDGVICGIPGMYCIVVYGVGEVFIGDL